MATTARAIPESVQRPCSMSVFCIATVFWALPTAMISNQYGWFLIVSVACLFFTRHLMRTSKTFTAIAKCASFRRMCKKQWFHWILSILIFSLLLILVYLSLPNFEAKDLLFSPVNNAQVLNRSNEVYTKNLEKNYIKSIIIITYSILILLFTFKISKLLNRKWINFVKLSSIIIIIQVLFLPMSYALNVMSNKFHELSEIRLNKENDTKISCCERVWLLYEQGTEYILYNGDTKEIFLLSKGNVIDLGLKKRENIFARM